MTSFAAQNAARAHLRRIGFTSDEQLRDEIRSEYRLLTDRPRPLYGIGYTMAPALIASCAELPELQSDNMFVHVAVQHPATPPQVLSRIADAALGQTVEKWAGVRSSVPHQNPTLQMMFLMRHPNLDSADRVRLLASGLHGLAGDASATDQTLTPAEIDQIIEVAHADTDYALPALVQTQAMVEKARAAGASRDDLVPLADEVRHYKNCLPLPLIRFDQTQQLTSSQLARVAALLARIGVEQIRHQDPRFVKIRHALVDPSRPYAKLLPEADASVLLLDAALA